jgi:hypothetical protein
VSARTILRRRPLSLALLSAAALAASGAARAFDLTGTWEGRQSCTGFDGERFRFRIPSERGDISTLQISQAGTALALRVPDAQGGGDVYSGFGIDALDKPEGGQIYIVRCGTDDDLSTLQGGFDETGSGAVKTKPDGSATLKLLSTFFNAGPEIAFCRWSYKRLDTANPNVPGCP